MSGRLVVHSVFLLLALGTKAGDAMPLKDTLFVVHPVGPPQEGYTVTLTCYIDGPSAALVPRPSSYVWVKDGKVIPGQSGVKLTLSHLKKQDEGDYQCGDPDSDVPRGKHQLRLSDGGAGPAQDQFVVHAEGTQREGHTVNLTCYINGSTAAFVPRPSAYEWVKDGKVIPGQSGVTLTLRHVTRQDEGDFQCGDPDSSLPRGKYQLNLLNLENFFLISALEVNEEDNLTLTCGVDSHLEAHLAWIVNGQEVRHVTDKLDHYVIKSAACSDSGNYTCLASNADMPGRQINLTTQVRVHCKKGQVTETNNPGMVGSATTAVILVVIVIVLVIVIFIHRRKTSLPSIRTGGTSTVSLVPGSSPIRFKMNDGSLCFDKFYEKGKVYVFPTLVPPEEKVPPEETPKANNEENSELTPLLNQNSEDVEVYRVKDLIRHTLQILTGANGLPSFVLHNTHLSKEEKVVLILSRRLGLIMMIVKVEKATKDGIQMKSLERAVEHLMASRKLVEKHFHQFVKSGMIKTALVLPNLSETDWNRFRKKFKDVEVLLGKEKEDAERWIEQLTKGSNSDVWELNTPEATSPDAAFKMATSEFLTLAASYHPDESPKHPTTTESCLMTPVQMEVRDSRAKLLHLYGPPGSGKTTLLIHRARQWLAEGKAVVLAVGRDFFDVLLAFVIKGVLIGQNEETLKRIRICRKHKILSSTVAELQSLYPNIEICLIIDTLRENVLLRNMLNLVQYKKVSAAWTVCRDKLEVINNKLSAKCHELGWETISLPESIRCTPDTVELLNRLGQGSNHHHPITACSVPRYQEIPKRRILTHYLHASTQSSCDSCKTELSQAVPFSKHGQHWEDWIAICTGNPRDLSDLQPLCATLQTFGLPASLDKQYDIVASHGSRIDSSDTDITKWLERVVAGNDEKGNPTLHLVRVNDVGGVEKEGVLVVHHDERDTDPDCQSEKVKVTRLNEHRQQWIWAVSRCKGQVILLLLTPSPACCLLNLSGKE